MIEMSRPAVDDPWPQERAGAEGFVPRADLPEIPAVPAPRPVAVSADLSGIGVIIAFAVMGLTIAALFTTFATVDGRAVVLADDRSAALALVASAVVGVLAVFVVRAPSGIGVGLLAGAEMNILLLHERLAAGVLADGTSIVRWSTGFVLLSFAAFGGLATLLIALTGVRAGQRVTQVPSIIAVPVLALVIAAIVIERTNLLDAAYGLGAAARALAAGALFLEGMVWVSAVASRSRLGAGMLIGSTITCLVVAVDGARPARGLLATVGFGMPATLGAVAGVILLAAAMLALCAWPEDHPVRRGLTRANEAARLS